MLLIDDAKHVDKKMKCPSTLKLTISDNNNGNTHRAFTDCDQVDIKNLKNNIKYVKLKVWLPKFR